MKEIVCTEFTVYEADRCLERSEHQKAMTARERIEAIRRGSVSSCPASRGSQKPGPAELLVSAAWRAIRLIERDDVMFTDGSRKEAIQTLIKLRAALKPTKPRN